MKTASGIKIDGKNMEEWCQLLTEARRIAEETHDAAVREWAKDRERYIIDRMELISAKQDEMILDQVFK